MVPIFDQTVREILEGLMKPKKYETAKYTYKAMQLSSKLVAAAFSF